MGGVYFTGLSPSSPMLETSEAGLSFGNAEEATACHPIGRVRCQRWAPWSDAAKSSEKVQVHSADPPFWLTFITVSEWSPASQDQVRLERPLWFAEGADAGASGWIVGWRCTAGALCNVANDISNRLVVRGQPPQSFFCPLEYGRTYLAGISRGSWLSVLSLRLR